MSSRIRFTLLGLICCIALTWFPPVGPRPVAGQSAALPREIVANVNALAQGRQTAITEENTSVPPPSLDPNYRGSSTGGSQRCRMVQGATVLGWSNDVAVPVSTTCAAPPFSLLKVTVSATLLSAVDPPSYKMDAWLCQNAPLSQPPQNYCTDHSIGFTAVGVAATSTAHLILAGKVRTLYFTARAAQSGSLARQQPNIEASWTVETIDISQGFAPGSGTTCVQGSAYQQGDFPAHLVQDYVGDPVTLQPGGNYILTHQLATMPEIAGGIAAVNHYAQDGTLLGSFSTPRILPPDQSEHQYPFTTPSAGGYAYSRIVLPVGNLSIQNNIQSLQKVSIMSTNGAICGYQPRVADDEAKAEEDPCLTSQPQGFAGDPVNTATGNLTLQSVDLDVPTYGRPLRFVRSYNSQDALSTPGSLGAGWTHSYAMKLTLLPDRAEVTADHGSVVRFSRSGSIFTPGPGVRATLSLLNGLYVLQRCTGERDFFNAAGLLVSQRSREGNLTTLTYENNQLSVVQSPGYRELRFFYTGERLTEVRLTSLHVSETRSLFFSYTPSGLLEYATDLRGERTTYRYRTADLVNPALPAPAPLLEEVIDPENRRVFKVEYDADWRVSREWVATAAIPMTFAYQPDRTTITDAAGNVTIHHYSPQAMLTHIVEAHGTPDQAITRIAAYDRFRNPVKVVEPRGFVSQIAFDTTCGCRPTIITDTYGLTATMRYSAAGDLLSSTTTSLTEPRYRTTWYTYNTRRQLERIEANVDGVRRTLSQFVYAGDYNLLSQVIDANGKITRLEYAGVDRLALWNWKYPVAIIDPLGHRTELDYTLLGQVSSVRNRRGFLTRYERDNAGLITRVIQNEQPGGPVNQEINVASSFTYDKSGMLTAMTSAPVVIGAQGMKTTFDYDAAGRLLKKVLNATTTGTDANRNVTYLNEYDDAGRLKRSRDARGFWSSYTYDARNRLSSATDPLGHSRSFRYDLAGNLTELWDANGLQQQATYDGNNLPTAIANAMGATISYQYDEAGRLVLQRDPRGFQTAYLYDELGRLEHVVENWRETSPGVAPRDRETNVWTQYGYDLAGNLLFVEDPRRGLQTGVGRVSYTYTARNELERLTDAAGQSWQFHYDPNGNLDQEQTPVQATPRRYVYDPLDRVQQIKRPDGSSEVSYTYHPVGTRSAMDDSLGHWTYTYDGLLRLWSVQDPRPTLGTINFQYDADSNRAWIATPGMLRVSRYDAAGRLTQLDNGSTSIYARYRYDDADRLVETTLGNGVILSYRHDAASRLSEIRQQRPGDVEHIQLRYDANDNLVQREIWTGPFKVSVPMTTYQEEPTPTPTQAATNTTLAQPQSQSLVAATATRTRTATATRTRTATRTASRTATSNPYPAPGGMQAQQGKVIESSAGDTHAAVAEGLASADVSSGGQLRHFAEYYTYDPLNRLVGVRDRWGGSASYAYDALGNRTSATSNGSTSSVDYTSTSAIQRVNGVDVAGRTDAAGRLTQSVSGLNRSFTYDTFDRLTGVSGAANTQMIYNGDGQLVAEVINGVRSDYLIDPVGYEQIAEARTGGGTPVSYLWGMGRVGEQQNGVLTYATTDEQGSIRFQTNSSGQPSEALHYDAWGTPKQAQPNRWGLSGERWQGESGLLHLRSRWYMPEIGRFLTKDAWPGDTAVPQTLNPYAYALNNPTSLTDPSGNCPICVAVGAGALLGGLIDYGVQVWQNHQKGLHGWDAWVGCVSFGQVLVAAAGGALAGGIGFVAVTVFGTGLGVAIGGGIISSVAAQLLTNALTGQPWHHGLVQSAIIGALGGVIGWGIGKLVKRALSGAGGCPNSFDANTPVATENGPRPIAEIAVGDQVLAYDEATGQTGSYTVTATISHVDPSYLRLSIGTETLETTAEHPFYVEGDGWVEADALRFGDQVRQASGGTGMVISVAAVAHLQRMYNLTVDVAHTFFVGDGQWLVHNCKATDMPITRPGTKEWRNAVKDMKTPGGKDYRVPCLADAQCLLREARGDIPRMGSSSDPYNNSGLPYKRGYEVHPNEGHTLNAPQNNMPHIKWKDWSQGKARGAYGHIFFEE